MSQITYPVSFNYIDLGTINGLTVLAVDAYLPPKRTLSSFQLARTDRAKINSAFYTDKSITVRVGITRNTRSLTEQSTDSLMNMLQGMEKDLIVPQGGSPRRYVATLADPVYRVSGGSYVEIDLVFKLSDKFGYDVNFTSLLAASGRTLYNYTDPFTIAGSAAWQVPIIKVTFTALTSGTSKDVTVLNPATGQSITVNRTWAAGDILIIDTQNETVTVNGTNTDFTGAFPQWSVGAGYIQVTDGFLTRTKTEFVYYYKRYV